MRRGPVLAVVVLLALPGACKPRPSGEARAEQLGDAAPEVEADTAREALAPAGELVPTHARLVVESGPDEAGAAVYQVELPAPRHEPGTGPTVALDEAHDNLQIPKNYAVFAQILAADGFVVEPNREPFTAASLRGVDLLVIVNPLHPNNVGNWELPTPSAFTAAEIDAVAGWVGEGGALWVIADHMPFPGAAGELADRFGFSLANGFAFREVEPGMIAQAPIGFSRADATIVDGHPITAGLEQIWSFTGEAFEMPPEASALLVMPDDGIALLPTRAWVFDADTPRQRIGGWPVAAVRDFGRGRVAMFGEAAMLSARYAETPDGWLPVGVHHPDARDNLRLVLATARWLTGSQRPFDAEQAAQTPSAGSRYTSTGCTSLTSTSRPTTTTIGTWSCVSW